MIGFEGDYIVTDDRCWVWQRSVNSSGYGHLNRVFPDGRRRTSTAHRYYYFWTHGEVPEGLVLDHLCRNRLCCNPDHLEPVTPTENVVRGLRGLLTAKDVGAIRFAWQQGIPQTEIAAFWGIDRSHVSKIISDDRRADAAPTCRLCRAETLRSLRETATEKFTVRLEQYPVSVEKEAA